MRVRSSNCRSIFAARLVGTPSEALQKTGEEEEEEEEEVEEEEVIKKSDRYKQFSQASKLRFNITPQYMYVG